MRKTTAVVCSAFAFAMGFAVANWQPAARAADDVISAQIIHVPSLVYNDLSAPPPVGDMRSKTLVSVDGMTIAVQEGNVARHTHPNTHEIQYIVSGEGKLSLGDSERDVRAGDLIIIPKGVIHGGTKPVSGRFRAIAIKTPPQKPGDTVFVQ